jgi:hypothetical protein
MTTTAISASTEDIAAGSTIGSSETVVSTRTTVSSDVGRAPSRIPFSVPLDQAYYWSAKWQEAERRALDAIRLGDYVDFDSEDPNDVVRWMLSAD